MGNPNFWINWSHRHHVRRKLLVFPQSFFILFCSVFIVFSSAVRVRVDRGLNVVSLSLEIEF